MTARAAVPLSADRSPAFQEAERFLRLYYTETARREAGQREAARQEVGRPGLNRRLEEVEAELARDGAFTLTTAELTYGAKVAWRNSTRCVGRGYWPVLELHDLRHVTDPEQVFAELLKHLERAWNGGRLRTVISVFGPGVQVLSPQLIRYAGYRQPDGGLLGDPQNLDLTRQLLALGWLAPETRTPFDVLPVAIQSGDQVRLFTLPSEAVREVQFSHPTLPEVAQLGLK